MLKAYGIGKCLEAERGVGRSVEKGGSVAFVLEHLRQSQEVVIGIDVVAIGVNVAWNAGKRCRHAVNGAHAVGKAPAETVALGQQRIQEGCVALELATVALLVEITHVLH